MTPSRTALTFVVLLPSPALAQSSWLDPVGDAVIRETDIGGPTTFNANALPDIVSLSIVPWQATDPVNDPYTGQQVPAAGADLFRLDVVLAGLFNPPGLLFPFQPAAFGPRPVFLDVEIDLDNNTDSGGEMQPIAVERYLGNVGRFGALPSGTLGARAATSSTDYDNFFSVGRQFERSGIDMTLALCGCGDIFAVTEIGDQNGVMDPGETFIVNGEFLERFRALNPYSGVFGSFSGAYLVTVDVRYQHDIATNRTTVTLVYPLTQEGASLLTGEPLQPADSSVANHTSVQELMFSTIRDSSGCCAPIFNDPDVVALTIPWQNPNWTDPASVLAQANQFLDPAQWRATVLAGTAYTTPFTNPYVWTDIGFGARFADLNADGVLTGADEAALAAIITALDGDPAHDADLTTNGIIVVPDPGPNFEIADLNGDGIVNSADVGVLILARTDLNSDGRINGADISFILSSFGPCTDCSADLNNDGVVNGADISNILSNWNP